MEYYMRFSLLLTLLCLFEKISSTSFVEYSEVIDHDNYKLNWAISESENLIRFSLDVKTLGWVAIGFSPSGQMPNSDMYIGYIKSDGTVVFYDGYATSRSQPKQDKDIGGKSDITDVSGKVTGGRTLITFTRKLVTGDVYDYDIKKGELVNVIFAFRSSGNPETEGGVYNIHSAKYFKKLYLYPTGQTTTQQSLSDKYKDQPDVKRMTLTFPQVPIPTTDTSYLCRLYNVNTEVNKLFNNNDKDTSYHAIAFDAVIDNMAMVHHLLLYTCDKDNIMWFTNTVHCEDLLPDCYNVVFAWAPGQSHFVLPNETGMRWGTHDTFFVLMQVHYTNPTFIQGQVDSSGVEVFFTPKLRKHDAGIGMYGPITRGIKLPPYTKNTIASNVCPKGCTSKISQDGAYVPFYAAHGHKNARKIRAELTYPDGTKDTTTFRVDNYDYNKQEFMPVKDFILKKDVEINTICEYDTSKESQTITGGLKTSDEMCIIFFVYYPIQNAPVYCQSYSDTYQCSMGKSQERVIMPGYSHSRVQSLSILLLALIALLYLP